jgi:hypothetical protein
MMGWDYRVFREEDGGYVVREVYYDDDGSITACTQDAVEPMGESIEELTRDIDYFKQALRLPVLTLADVPTRRKTKHNGIRGKSLTSDQIRAELGVGQSGNHQNARMKTATRRVGTSRRLTGKKEENPRAKAKR